MSEGLIARLGRWVDLSSVEIDLVQNLMGKGLALKRDDRPILAHQRSQWALLVLNGCAALFKDGESGRRTITEFVLPGELLPPTPFIDGSTAVGILSSSEVMLIPAQAYARLCENDVLREALDWLEAIRESVRSEWLVNISSRNAPRRLAHLLCELNARLNCAGLVSSQSFDLFMNQADLAGALALSIPHVNVALQRLRKDGLIELTGKHLTLLDWPGLQAFGGFNAQYLLRWPTRLADRRNGQRPRSGGIERRGCGLG